MAQHCLFLLLALVPFVNAAVTCPRLPSGETITCAFECCESFGGKAQGYFCCGMDDKRISTQSDANRPRSERFVAYSNGFQVDYSLLILGIVISIILSILLSLLCCFLCNSCWLRRRDDREYGHVDDSGFYPICCNFLLAGSASIPTGTIVLSSQRPQFHNGDGIYNGSSASSHRGVRFNEDGQPRGVLKNNSHYT
ncbi:hypothetical protein M3Y97_00083300 [Aphelenchoides bicaudatus]|nr:hypothetical protein M3Y97_00083300 [Aphelenchoides bicaudatus]